MKRLRPPLRALRPLGMLLMAVATLAGGWGLALANPIQTQSIALKKGWNAISVRVDPAAPAPNDVFRGVPVDKVAVYLATGTPLEYIQDPAAKPWKQKGWRAWFNESSPDAFISDLSAIQSGQCYLVHAIEATTLNLTGTVAHHRVSWRGDSFNMVGFPVDPEQPPTFSAWFAGSAAHQSTARTVVYQLDETDRWAPVTRPERTLIQPVNVSTGKWHHVVVNFVRNSSVDLYVDGALVQKVGQPVYNFDSTNSYRVGLSPLDGHPFFGKVDELRIWERARTPAEIRRAAETKPALGSTEKSLRLYYSFNESDGVALSVGPVQSGLPAELRGISRVQDASLVLGPPLPPPTDFALAFNGVNQSARTAIDGALLAGDEFTIEYWFKGRRLQSAVRLQPTNGSTWMVSGHGAPAQVNNLVNPGTGNVSARVDSVFAVNDGVIWHHVALTWQRGTANGLRSYLDGVLRGSGNTDATPFPVIAAPIWLGSFNGTSEFMDGAIDEVRIWKRVLPPSEIEQHARDVRRLSGDERGLAAYFDFNDQDAAGPLDLVSGKRGTFSNTGACPICVNLTFHQAKSSVSLPVCSVCVASPRAWSRFDARC